MQRQCFGVEKIPGFSSVVIVNNEIFLSSINGISPENFHDAVSQTKLICDKLKNLLEKSGCNVDDIKKVGIYVSAQKDVEAVMSEVASFLGDIKPCISCICVDLEDENMLVKLDCQAYKRCTE